MRRGEFIDQLNELYLLIEARYKNVYNNYMENGYLKSEVKSEDIDLSDILETKLLPFFNEILIQYPINRSLDFKMEAVFFATLCEIAKKGIIGGILQTMRENLNEVFDTNRYYKIMKNAVATFNIEVLESGRKYENAIIGEAGIPRGMHKTIMELFHIYWKWFKFTSREIREKQLSRFLLKNNFTDEYILDSYDYYRLVNLAKVIKDENIIVKAIKSCNKLDEVFSKFDEYEEVITLDNIDMVCNNISQDLGYNILTIINEKELKAELFRYANRVSFSKFKKILNNLPINEKIILPTGKTVERNKIHIDNCICGYYNVRGVEYEVTYSIAPGVKELINLEKYKIHNIDGYTVYLSDEYFDVEINNWSHIIREISYMYERCYIYASKIPAGSIAYIDDEIINLEDKVQLSCGYKKYWDEKLHQNILSVKVYKACFFDPKGKNKELYLECNGKILNKKINSHGYAEFTEQWFPVFDAQETISVELKVDDEVIEKKEIELPDYVLYGKYNGLRVDEVINRDVWFGENEVVFFTKCDVYNQKNINIKKISKFADYNVYEGYFDATQHEFYIDNHEYVIKNSNYPYIRPEGEYTYNNEKLTFVSFENVSFKIIGNSSRHLILKIGHCGEFKVINVSDCCSEIFISEYIDKPGIYSGKWEISLIEEQTVVSCVEFVILPEIKVIKSPGMLRTGMKGSYQIKLNEGDIYNADKSENIKNIEIYMPDVQTGKKWIEHELYLENCDVTTKINLPVEVWQITVNGEDISNNSKIIDYSELDEHKIVIATNCDSKFKINFNGRNSNIDCKSGENAIDLSNTCDEVRQINNLEIIDENQNIGCVSIRYNPKLALVPGYKVIGGLILFKIRYKGPIKTPIEISIFENYRRIGKIKYTTRNNNEIYSLKLEHPKNEFRKLSVEYSIGGGSSDLLGELEIEQEICNAGENTKQEISEYKNLYKLLRGKISTDKKLTSKFFKIIKCEE